MRHRLRHPLVRWDRVALRLRDYQPRMTARFTARLSTGPRPVLWCSMLPTRSEWACRRYRGWGASGDGSLPAVVRDLFRRSRTGDIAASRSRRWCRLRGWAAARFAQAASAPGGQQTDFGQLEPGSLD